MAELLIEGGTVVTPCGSGPAHIYIRAGKIQGIGRRKRKASQVFSATGLVVFPGVVDAHVHFALPVAGTRSADDFLTGSQAAAAGGVTTVIDFSVGSPDKSIPQAIGERLAQAAPMVVDFSLHAELVGWSPGRAVEIAQAAELGVRSFGEIFTTYSDSGRRTPLGHLKAAMTFIREINGVAMVHAEADELVDAGRGPFPWARPSLSEEVAVTEVAVLARATQCQTYIAHISSASGLSALLWGRRSGAPLWGETCPHYLLLDQSVYVRPDGHRFSVIPPLRTQADQAALWTGLQRRQLQAVATDHCSFTSSQKDPFRAEPAKLPCGLPGVETLLPLLFSAGVAEGRLTLRQLAWCLAEGPARAFGLWPRKGAIRPGADADLVLLDPNHSWTIQARDMHMATDFSPYEGFSVRGKIVAVLSRGEWIYQDGEILAQPGRGQFIPWQK